MCTYSGVVPQNSCSEFLICEVCAYTWRDPANYTYWESFVSGFKNLCKRDLQSFNFLHNLLFEEPCPRCGVYIYKEGGCNHMYCQKCKHEFCWFCLGPFYEYQHTVNLACPYRYFATVGALFLGFFLLNYKLIYRYQTMFNFEWIIFYNLSAFLTIDLYIASALLYVPLYEEIKSLRRRLGRMNDKYTKREIAGFVCLGILLFFF